MSKFWSKLNFGAMTVILNNNLYSFFYNVNCVRGVTYPICPCPTICAACEECPPSPSGKFILHPEGRSYGQTVEKMNFVYYLFEPFLKSLGGLGAGSSLMLCVYGSFHKQVNIVGHNGS